MKRNRFWRCHELHPLSFVFGPDGLRSTVTSASCPKQAKAAENLEKGGFGQHRAMMCVGWLLPLFHVFGLG